MTERAEITVRVVVLGRSVRKVHGAPGVPLSRLLAGAGIETAGRDVHVNGRPAETNTALGDGDLVTVIPRVRGGGWHPPGLSSATTMAAFFPEERNANRRRRGSSFRPWTADLFLPGKRSAYLHHGDIAWRLVTADLSLPEEHIGGGRSRSGLATPRSPRIGDADVYNDAASRGPRGGTRSVASSVSIDPELCIGSGDCSRVAPDAFELLEDRGVSVPRPAAATTDVELLLKAAVGCPTQAIRVVAEDGSVLHAGNTA